MPLSATLLVEKTHVTVRGTRHRTTVPKTTFNYLQLKDKDILLWTLHKNGLITVAKEG